MYLLGIYLPECWRRAKSVHLPETHGICMPMPAVHAAFSDGDDWWAGQTRLMGERRQVARDDDCSLRKPAVYSVSLRVHPAFIFLP